MKERKRTELERAAWDRSFGDTTMRRKKPKHPKHMTATQLLKTAYGPEHEIKKASSRTCSGWLLARDGVPYKQRSTSFKCHLTLRYQFFPNRLSALDNAASGDELFPATLTWEVPKKGKR